MKLTLVLKGPDRLMGAQIEKSMENGSLVIGRSPTADWTLPDPDRVISKAHCRIDKDSGGFVLTDTSTNGVEINNDAVGFGLPRLLANGDVLKLGDAVVIVRIENSTQAPPLASSTPRQLPAVDRTRIADGPFGLPDKAAAQRPDFSVPQDRDIAGRPVGQILDDWWAPTSPVSDPISVDISAKQAPDTIHNTITAQESLPSRSGSMTKLAASLTRLDLAALVQAVDTAAEVLPEGERSRFYERLRDLLDGNRSQGK
ncbi:type VI secretion system-associated FHA domain protein [Mesorhizobium shangrilense]|uniref:FHA domain-containing protein n=1 Tax=Mesorhizobium shangrilense TaxID=460060 RepID=A0ABV2DA37_9HYPH